MGTPARASALLLGIVAFATGCPVSVAPQPPPARQPNYPTGQSGANPPTDGSACNRAADCQSGVCEGGCEPGQAVCVSARRACVMSIAEFCGCDGATFTSSGTCPGRQFAHAGACGATVPAALAPDGASCTDAKDCASGVCEGGCNAGEAKCAPKNRPCTLDLVEYCDCTNVTFTASGSCPQRRFSKRGACQVVQ